MKKLILYVMMMGIVIAINSCEKETLEPDNLVGTIRFKDGLFHTVNFTVSLDKTRYIVGETAIATVSVSENFRKTKGLYVGSVTVAGKFYSLFDSETFWLQSYVVVRDISVETTPGISGIYSAVFAVSRSGYIFPTDKTKEVSIPYEIRQSETD